VHHQQHQPSVGVSSPKEPFGAVQQQPKIFDKALHLSLSHRVFGVSIGGGDQPYVPILGIVANRCPVLTNL